MSNKKAVILLSGGLDSAVTLYYARSEGHDCSCLFFKYGQRHAREIESARRVAESAGSRLEVIAIPFSWKGSSLLDESVRMPSGRSVAAIRLAAEAPNTYVPARNTVFLAVAASYAEATGASRIFIGAHSEDSSGYPDCRREYLEAFDRVLALGTKSGVSGELKLEFPLIGMPKSDIVRLGARLGVPFGLTRSCYESSEEPCGVCDSCVLRDNGFKEAGLYDPVFGNK